VQPEGSGKTAQGTTRTRDAPVELASEVPPAASGCPTGVRLRQPTDYLRLRVTIECAAGCFRPAGIPSSGRVHCVAIASLARISWCAARSSNEASVISTITRRIVPVNANGDWYRSETGETVSQPTSKVSFTVK